MPNSNLSEFKLGKTLNHKEGGYMVNVPLKKKKCRLARLGKPPLHQNIRMTKGGTFLHSKTSFPPLSKAIPTGFTSLQP